MRGGGATLFKNEVTAPVVFEVSDGPVRIRALTGRP